MHLPSIEERSLVHLGGSDYEMGLQQGQKFQGFLQYLADWIWKTDMVSRHVPKILPKRLLLAIAKRFSRSKVESLLRKHCPNQLEYLRGISDGGNVDIRVLYILIYAEGFFSKKRYAIGSSGPDLGCTSIAVAPGKTGNLGFVIGKNFDYNLEFQPLLLGRYLDYEDGSKIIGHGGVGQAGTFHGMNNSGLIVSYDYAHPTDTNLSGIPSSVLVQKSLQECRTVDEVVYLFRNTPRAGGSLILAADNTTKKAVVLECSGTQLAVRWMDPEKNYIAVTNHYITDQMRKIDLPKNAVYDKSAEPYRQGRLISESSRIRYHDALSELKSKKCFEIEDVAEILRHHHDGIKDYRSICCHDLPSHGTNMWAIFSPANGSMYSAIGQPCESKLKKYEFN